MGTFFTFLVIAIVIGILIQIMRFFNDNTHANDTYKVLMNLKEFKADSHYLSTTSGITIGIDSQRKKICLLDNMHKSFIFDYNKILQCELQIDDESVLKTSTSEIIGRSFLGSILGGSVGAIIGGTTSSVSMKSNIYSIDLRIIVIDTNNPVFIINFLNIKINKGSMIYKRAYEKAEHWYAIISGLIRNNNNENSNTHINTISVADEIKKLKDLLDADTITYEEFTKQKSKLIN